LDSPPDAISAASATVEAFLARISQLSAAQWEHVMDRAAGLGAALDRDDVVRGAVVAIAVRHLLRPAQFELLYMPFAEAVPVTTLYPGSRLQN
jgi:hypothetical protein